MVFDPPTHHDGSRIGSHNGEYSRVKILITPIFRFSPFLISGQRVGGKVIFSSSYSSLSQIFIKCLYEVMIRRIYDFFCYIVVISSCIDSLTRFYYIYQLFSPFFTSFSISPSRFHHSSLPSLPPSYPTLPPITLHCPVTHLRAALNSQGSTQLYPLWCLGKAVF